MHRQSKTFAALVLGIVIIGCADSQHPTTRPTTRTSDAALNDPFGNWSKVDTDVSGGHTKDYKDQSIKGDVNRVLLK
jgi:hypothetical protein